MCERQGGGGGMKEQQTKLVLGEGNMGLKWALAVTQGLLSPLTFIIQNSRANLDLGCTPLCMHACMHPWWVRFAPNGRRLQFDCLSAEHSIRVLSDSVLSSGRLKMTHHLSPELGFHKHIPFHFHSFELCTTSEAVWQFANNQDSVCHVN